MVDVEPDVKADIKAAKDRGESISLMEPLLIGESSKHRAGLTDLALELAQKSAGFRRSLPESLLASLADLRRAASPRCRGRQARPHQRARDTALSETL